MRKWILKTTLAFCLAAGLAPAAVAPASAASADASWLDTSYLGQGTIGVSYSANTSKRVKVMITKASTVYTYDLNTAKKSETFPLQSGAGSYEVTLLENTSGTSYKKIDSTSVELSKDSEAKVFLGSVQNVNWKDAKSATALAAKLTAGKNTDKEKVQAIYNYVVSNIKYDNELAASVGSVYIPSADSTLASKKGICYDYASLMGVMLRSSGVPAKLVMGNTTYVKEYHAWNEVYLDGKWVIVDATVDAAYKQAGKTIEFSKQANKYSAQKVY
ncbi:transglutaminase domain-containing protein [Saccharibacillus alkalitolerans]|uniref:Transglutaminase domain-containing protein n=1 Tax=Saccharibacillus alkalitolerans TaxID=2705290 RepID=A0ABX0FCS3_9BACL|nr:transglutaminase-like domain-containing protein [Saccharibacillus alkalitolerans]NGZ77959.1 transglutaminase domain-containing protein [Saccharibacillus alkalitolerans]